MVRKGNPLYPLTNSIPRLYFAKAKLRAKANMAIYHFSVKAISRSAGRSVVAAAAYRSGEN